MSYRDQAARTATRVTAYRIARRTGIGALFVFTAGLWASLLGQKPRRRREERESTVKRRITVKELAREVLETSPKNTPPYWLAEAVMEHIEREEAGI